MKFKCPSCVRVVEFTQEEIRKIILKCPVCGRQFRPSECSPILGGDKNMDKEIEQTLSKTTQGLHSSRAEKGKVPPKKTRWF